jgi:hypothetical protein
VTVLLESRIEELVADGSRRDAAELATAALKNDAVVDVSVDDDAVTVETRRFRGVHDVRRDGDRPLVVQQGEYEVKGDLDFEFATATMHDDALDAARAELRAPDADDAEDALAAGAAASPTAAEAAGGSAEAATDGGSEPDDEGGVMSRFAATLRTLVS